MQQVIDPLSAIRWLIVQNLGEETVPAFGVARPAVADETGALGVLPPDADGQEVLVNGPIAIEPGEYGQATWDSPIHALYDEDTGDPTEDYEEFVGVNGAMWGAQAGSFKLKKGYEGFYSQNGVVLQSDTSPVNYLLVRRHSPYIRAVKIVATVPTSSPYDDRPADAGGPTVYRGLLQNYRAEFAIGGGRPGITTAAGPSGGVAPCYVIELDNQPLVADKKYPAFSAGSLTIGDVTLPCWITWSGPSIRYSALTWFTGLRYFGIDPNGGVRLTTSPNPPTGGELPGPADGKLYVSLWDYGATDLDWTKIGGVTDKGQTFDGAKSFNNHLAVLGAFTFTVGKIGSNYTLLADTDGRLYLEGANAGVTVSGLEGITTDVLLPDGQMLKFFGGILYDVEGTSETIYLDPGTA